MDGLLESIRQLDNGEGVERELVDLCASVSTHVGSFKESHFLYNREGIILPVTNPLHLLDFSPLSRE